MGLPGIRGAACTWIATPFGLAMTEVRGFAMTTTPSLRAKRGNPPTPSLRGGKADAAIQEFTVAPGPATHPPWTATGPPALAMTG